MPPKPIQRDRLRQTIQTLEGLTPEDRSALLGLLAETKRYGLVWEDKPEDAHELLREQIPVFKEDESRRIVATTSRSLSDSPQGDRIEGPVDDAPHHVLIEGDNLHALAALQYTHAGQVDVIYIDPPYNTGNKDFRYNDDYVDKEDTYRHSKWLSYMRRRLAISRTLLDDSGVIIASIDDNEFAQLAMLIREIFLEENDIARLPTIMNLKGNQDQFAFAGTHEYTIVASKSKSASKFGQFPISTDEALEGWELDDIGYFKRGAPLNSTGVDAPRSKRPFMFYPILIKGDLITTISAEEYKDIYNQDTKYFDDNHISQLKEKYEHLGYEFILPRTTNSSDGWGRWRWGYSPENIKRLEYDVLAVQGRTGTSLYKKQRPEISDLPSSKPKSLWYKPEYSSGNGTAQLKNILGASLDGESPIYPKPLQLIKDLIRIGSTKPTPLILDFFAGSGTTLHATMALNAEDGGKRQCILVTNNENRICEEVTYERNKRVIQGYTTPKGEQVAGLTANHLHYFKTEFVKREPTLKNRRQLMKLSVDLLRLKENAWDRIEALCVKNEVEAFRGKDFTLFVVLDTDAIPTVIGHIKAQSGRSKVYVFSPGAYAWDEEFEEVRERIDLCALPEAIYRALEPHLPAVKRIADEVAA